MAFLPKPYDEREIEKEKKNKEYVCFCSNSPVGRTCDPCRGFVLAVLRSLTASPSLLSHTSHLSSCPVNKTMKRPKTNYISIRWTHFPLSPSGCRRPPASAQRLEYKINTRNSKIHNEQLLSDNLIPRIPLQQQSSLIVCI